MNKWSYIEPGYYKCKRGTIVYVVGTKPHFDGTDWYSVVYCGLHKKGGPSMEFDLENVGSFKDTYTYIGKTLKHTITIDGKDIELSAESYKALKESLT